MRQKWNTWHIEPGYQADYDCDDFDSWFLAGGDRETRVTALHKQQLFENCIYLAEVENREIVGTPKQLRDQINQWAISWNCQAPAVES